MRQTIRIISSTAAAPQQPRLPQHYATIPSSRQIYQAKAQSSQLIVHSQSLHNDHSQPPCKANRYKHSRHSRHYRCTTVSSELATRDRRLTSLGLSKKLSSTTDPNQAHSHLRYNGLNSALQLLPAVLGSTAYFMSFTLLTDRKETTTNSYHAKSFAKSKILMSFYAICRLNFQYLAKILTMVLMR